MIDKSFLVENFAEVVKNLALREDENLLSLVEIAKNLSIEVSFLQKKWETLRAEQNLLSKSFVGKSHDKDLQQQAQELKEKIQEVDLNLIAKEDNLRQMLLFIPNLLDAEVHEGSNPVEIKRQVFARNIPNPKKHYEIFPELMDFERASYMSGSRFVVLRDALAKLERVLFNFMIDTHVSQYSYQEISSPFLVREKALVNTGNLPKFEADLFKTTDSYYLIPTAEVPLTNLAAEKRFKEEDLPWRFVGYTPCFRSEAGAAGRDTRGMIRMHQFGKVELVSITTDKNSEAEHQRMLAAACNILELLELTYRVIRLGAADTGFQSAKTYDIEVFCPGQGEFREISSCSNCKDFQARRMDSRFKDASGSRFVHTLNGSGLAVGRTMVAILENYQDGDNIRIPKVLLPYFAGKEWLI